MSDGEIRRWKLTEVEAYDGPEDRACHAWKGQTPRNAVMFGPPGVFYVYLCYGVHWMLNVVTGPVGFPAAVLIRGAGEVIGPGRVTKSLAIDRIQNQKPAQKSTGLWFESAKEIPDHEIETTPRIGIGYASEPWLSAPYRYVWHR
ncbi:putative 3-methyladenine DNA glycosylase [Cerasicoccus arenae]|uniref:Putative 3-methyladenine DNA glycosylase n=2 Tax=Cerasicoccus arenae TaxID=424488 RepID=A0A8J3DDW5_9BACT|nr:putative 3-methyladenine DNA glycosylase [Cerasicoccus arenae]